jgi:Tol biopolymer transport system component
MRLTAQAARAVLPALPILIAAGVPMGAAATSPSPPPEIRLRVVEQREIEILDSRIISMSPDGRWLAAVRPAGAYEDGELCVFDIDTLVERSCASLTPLEAGIRLDDVAWSPDGEHLALTEKALLIFIDGDLWLMDAATGELANLDDDGFSGALPLLRGAWPDGPISVPVNPAFSPDGRAIAYSRTLLTEAGPQRNAIATVPTSGGEPTDLATVADQPGIAYFGMEWPADGTRVLYSMHGVDRDAEWNGVWTIDAHDGSREHLLGRFLPDTYGPAVLDAAADGRTLLVYDPGLASGFEKRLPVYAVADAERGDVTPIVPISPALPPDAYVEWAALSPDGRHVLTLYRGTSPDLQVWVRDIAGREEVALLPDGLKAAGPIERGLLPTWSPDGRVFLTGGALFDRGTLLMLGEEADEIGAEG